MLRYIERPALSPLVPMEIPSDTPIVLNRYPTIPSSVTPSLASLARSSRCMLHGFPSNHTLETPTCVTEQAQQHITRSRPKQDDGCGEYYMAHWGEAKQQVRAVATASPKAPLTSTSTAKTEQIRGGISHTLGEPRGCGNREMSNNGVVLRSDTSPSTAMAKQ